MRLRLYILIRTLAGVGLALSVVAAIIIMVNMVELSRALAGRADPGFARLLELAALKTPTVLLQLLPFAFLFGAIGTFTALNRRNELIAMRAAGVSAWGFILPAAGAAFAVGLLTLSVLQPLAAELNARFEVIRAGLAQDPDRGTGEIWLRQGSASGQVVIHGRASDHGGQILRLSGVSLFEQQRDSAGLLRFSRRIEADEAVLTPGFWRLRHAREVQAGADQVNSDLMALPSPLDPRSAMERFVPPASASFWELPAVIISAERAGYASAAYRLRMQQLLATPLMLAAMTLLAAAFSLRLMRLGDLARIATAGVVLGFVVFFLNQFCGAMGSTEAIPIVLAAWAPPLLALLSGLTMLCYTEDG